MTVVTSIVYAMYEWINELGMSGMIGVGMGLWLMWWVWGYRSIKVPGPISIPVFGQFFQLLPFVMRKQVGQYFTEMHHQYGRIVRVPMIGGDIISVSDKDAIKCILNSPNQFNRSTKLVMMAQGILENALFFLIGDEVWKKHRKVIVPAFGMKHMRMVVEVSDDVVDHVIECFQKRISENEMKKCVVDMYQYMNCVALDVLGLVSFSVDFKSVEVMNIGGYGDARRVYDGIFEMIAGRFSWPVWCWKWVGLGSKGRRVKGLRRYMHELIEDVVKERKKLRQSYKNHDENDEKKGKWDCDVLDRLLDHEGIGSNHLTYHEIIGEMSGLFLAGHDTTANTMTFMILELCRHQRVMEKLVRENEEVLNRIGECITYENIHEFRYMDHVVKEIQRCYPAVNALLRECVTDVNVMGYTFKKGTLFRIGIGNVHHDETYWKDPDMFIPERWDNVVPNGSFIPFGDGQHVCVGQKLAAIEIRVVMIRLLRKFTFEVVDEEYEVINTITTGLKNGLRVLVKERI